MNEMRPQSSPLVDLKDPIQVHLLTETALSDSKEFEILSQEEVDSLKKQIQSLTMRVEQARANLAIQSKYRDAAISMARLYAPSKADGKRRSLLGNRMSDSAKEAEMEKQACERRCEELATELFTLEKRLMEPQRRLLEHTAGILQLTHRASSKKSGQPPAGAPMMMNGIPGSPESLYTYTNARNSVELPNDDFDFDRNMYLSLDPSGRQQPAAPGRARKNTIEIPMKSPIREQNAQLRELREELDKVREENERILEENIQLKMAEQQLKDELSRLTSEDNQLREDRERAMDEIARLQNRERELADENARMLDEASRIKDADARMRAIEEQVMGETEALRTRTAQQQGAMADAADKLQNLNSRLRDVLVAFNPAKHSASEVPPATGDPAESLVEQLEFLKMGIAAVTEEQQSGASEASREVENARAEAEAAASSLNRAAARLEGISRELQEVLGRAGANTPAVPEGGSLDDQLGYLEQAVDIVSDELARAIQQSSTASAAKQSVDQVDAVLMGLWDIIQTGEAELEQQRLERRRNRALGQGGDDEEDLSASSDIEGYIREPYSLQAFSAKVQRLYAQATSLREQKYILQRQIRQQRELNNRTESEKDLELQAKTEELERTQALLDDAELAAREAQAQLRQALADLDTLQKTTAANEAASSSSAKAAQSRIATLESDVRDAQTQLAEATAARAQLGSQIAELQSKLSEANASEKKLRADLKAKDDELDQLNTMVVELKTEVAFAKAELDGAYGSRKQRAAEAAAAAAAAGQTQAQTENQELNAQVQRLRGELESALRDLEEVTKESIAAERERVDLEGRLDDVVAQKAELEAEVEGLRARLDKAQEELDALKLSAKQQAPAASAAAGGGARSAGAMLSEQFRGVMKEERKKFQEELRVSSFPCYHLLSPALLS
jgi:chromosome segregation ATPase